MCLTDKPAKDLLKQQCPKLWYSYIMRLIVVIGILFVLASCSDSDTPENFGLSCWIKNPSSNRVIYEFNFDTNLVTQKFTANNSKMPRNGIDPSSRRPLRVYEPESLKW